MESNESLKDHLGMPWISWFRRILYDCHFDEPGVNTARCPIHGRWLYRREDIEAEAGVRWLCGVEGCDYRYSANTKGDWVRT